MPDEYQIEVYCDDESTRSGMHHGRTVKVMNFEWSNNPDIEYGDEFDHWFHDRVTSVAHSRVWRQMEKQRLLEREGAVPAIGEGTIKTGLARTLELWETLSEDADLPEPPVVMQTVYPDGTAQDTDVNDGGGYLKYVMRCSLCGLDIQHRARDVAPALEALRLAGMGRISLVSFGRAILASSKTE